jgi:hypothetical protein
LLDRHHGHAHAVLKLCVGSQDPPPMAQPPHPLIEKDVTAMLGAAAPASMWKGWHIDLHLVGRQAHWHAGVTLQARRDKIGPSTMPSLLTNCHRSRYAIANHNHRWSRSGRHSPSPWLCPGRHLAAAVSRWLCPATPEPEWWREGVAPGRCGTAARGLVLRGAAPPRG